MHKEDKLDEAIAQYDKAVLAYPRCPGVHYNRGLAFRKKGQLDSAVTDYSQAIDLDPRFVDAYANRGYAYFKLGEFAAALADFDKGVGVGPAERRRAKKPRAASPEARGEVRALRTDFES